MKVTNQFIAVIVQFETVPNVCSGQRSRDASAILEHLLKCACVCIELRITKVAPVFLKREVFAVLQSDRVSSDVDREACGLHQPRHRGFAWPLFKLAMQSNGCVHE